MTTGTMREIVMSAAEVADQRRERGVDQTPGVKRTVLWERAGSAAGVLELQPAAEIGEHTHTEHGHHVWVVSGEAEVLGKRLEPGAYWFVPPAVAHALVAGDAGCELFYVYERSTG